MSFSSGSNSSSEHHLPKPPSGVPKPAFVRRSRASRSSSKLPVPLKIMVSENTQTVTAFPKHSSGRETSRSAKTQKTQKVPLGRFHPLPAIPKQNGPMSSNNNNNYNDSIDCMVEAFRKHRINQGNNSARLTSSSFEDLDGHMGPRCTLCSPNTSSAQRSRSVDDRKHLRRMARFLRCVGARNDGSLRPQTTDTEDIIGYGAMLDDSQTKGPEEETGQVNLRRLIRSNTYDVIPVGSAAQQQEIEAKDPSRSQSVINHEQAKDTSGSRVLPKRPSTTVLVPSVDANTVLLAVRLPSGERVLGHFNEMDRLGTVVGFAERASGGSLANHVLMTNGAPIRLYRDLDMTLSELGLTSRTLLYVVSDNSNTSCFS